MEKIHIFNTLGQSVCSKDFFENSYNEVTIPKNIYEMDKKQFCKDCAWHIGKPYFDNDILHEMGAEDDDYLDDTYDDDDIFSHCMVVNVG